MDNAALSTCIYQLEKLLADHNVRTDKSRLSALLSDEFTEFGASGNIFTKADIINLLANEPEQSSYEIADFTVKTLGANTALATYFIPPRKNNDGVQKAGSRRSSIWQKHNGEWQLLFHQGTPVKQ